MTRRLLDLLAQMQEGIDAAMLQSIPLRSVTVNEGDDLKRAVGVALERLAEADLWIGEAVRLSTRALDQAILIDEELAAFVEEDGDPFLKED